MARIEVHERYPGEARDLAPELIKALAARLGAKVRPVDVHDHGHRDLVEINPFRATREVQAQIHGLATRQFARMIADVEKFVAARVAMREAERAAREKGGPDA